MKDLLVFSCFLAFFQIATAQNTLTWSDPIPVADVEYGFVGPKIHLNAAGEPVVMWGRNGDGDKLFAAKMEGSQFTEPESIGGDHNILIHAAEGPQMGGRADFIYVVYSDLDDDYTGMFSVRSLDGGATWDEPVQIISESERKNIVPSVTANQAGNPVVACLSSQGTWWNSRVDVLTSADQGLNFSDPVTSSEAAGGEVVCSCCPVEVMAFGGDIYTLFRNNDENIRDMWLTKAGDDFVFDESLDLDEYDWYIAACPAAGSRSTVFDSKLLSVWKSAATGNSLVYYSFADQDNMTMINSLALNQNQFTEPNQNFPDISGDANKVCVVWQQGAGSNIDVYFAYAENSVDGLIDFAQQVTDAPGHQQNPAIAFDGTSFHLVYADHESEQVMYVTSSTIPYVGVDENERASSLIYPNPASGYIQIGADVKGVVEIIDATGRVVLSLQVINNQPISVETLADGVYSVRHQNGDFLGQFVKAH